MPSGAETIDNITETRLTGFVIHGAILGSLLLLPLLGHIPVPVISGIFLYLGRKMMTGNLFLDRVGQAIVEERQLPMTNAYRLLPRLTVFKYLIIQTMMVSAIWFLKQSRSLALFFPSCIAFLVFTRVSFFFVNPVVIEISFNPLTWRFFFLLNRVNGRHICCHACSRTMSYGCLTQKCKPRIVGKAST
jgi:hypothetical protein